jgi:hypothetical protein
MKLPDGFKEAGTRIGSYPDSSLDLMEIKYIPDKGQVVVGINTWITQMCEEGNEEALKLLSSIPDLVKNSVAQYLKVQ